MACSTNNRSNWFIAIPIDLDLWYADFLGESEGLARVFNHEDLHLTIAFLGAVDESLAFKLWESLDLSVVRAFPLKFGRVECFGPKKKPSAFGLTLVEIHDELYTLHQNIAKNTLLLTGRNFAERSFRPHVTFARPERSATVDQRTESQRWALSRDFSAVPALLIKEIALYTWNEDRNAKLFRIVRRKSLGRDIEIL